VCVQKTIPFGAPVRHPDGVARKTNFAKDANGGLTLIDGLVVITKMNF